MINLLQATILGIVEGFTEFLPISSTAHLMLAAEILGLDQVSFLKTFEIAIQSGAILAVLVLYWKKFLDREILKRILAAFLPTAIIGFLLYKLIKVYLIGNLVVALWALLIGGLALIAFEYFWKREPTVRDVKEMNYKTAFLVGLCQALAVIPGVSRSASSIVGGLVGGLSREAIVEFSFLLAVPTILAATLYDLSKNYSLFTANEAGILSVGLVFSFLSAWLGIKFFLSFIRSRTFTAFGLYRIVLALVFFFFVLNR